MMLISFLGLSDAVQVSSSSERLGLMNQSCMTSLHCTARVSYSHGRNTDEDHKPSCHHTVNLADKNCNELFLTHIRATSRILSSNQGKTCDKNCNEIFQARSQPSLGV